MLKIILLIIGGFYVLRILQASFRFLTKYVTAKFTKAVTFSISLQKQTDPDNEYNYLTFDAPFYEEKHHFYFSVGFFGFYLAFVPIETIPLLLKEILKDKYLYQTERDWGQPIKPKNNEQISDSGVRVFNGLYVYSPESIQKNALVKIGLSDGADLMFISGHEIPDTKLNTYESKQAEWIREPLQTRLPSQRIFFESEGELIKIVDSWSLIHKDESIVSKTVQLLFTGVGNKVLAKTKHSGNIELFTPSEGLKFGVDKVKVKVFLRDNQVVYKAKKIEQIIAIKR